MISYDELLFSNCISSRYASTVQDKRERKQHVRTRNDEPPRRSCRLKESGRQGFDGENAPEELGVSPEEKDQ